MTLHVREFRGEYAYLSNFFIEPDSTHVEGEYQSYKTNPPSLELRRMTPKQAKAVGQRLLLHSDWELLKEAVMYRLVLKKFTDHPTLAEALKRTGDGYLEEGNYWGDRFWGTVDGIGQNHLGRILMRVRRRIS